MGWLDSDKKTSRLHSAVGFVILPIILPIWSEAAAYPRDVGARRPALAGIATAHAVSRRAATLQEGRVAPRLKEGTHLGRRRVPILHEGGLPLGKKEDALF